MYISPVKLKFRLLLSRCLLHTFLCPQNSLKCSLVWPSADASCFTEKSETSREAPQLSLPLLSTPPILAGRFGLPQCKGSIVSVPPAKAQDSAGAPDPTGLWIDNVKAFISCSWLSPQLLAGVFTVTEEDGTFSNIRHYKIKRFAGRNNRTSTSGLMWLTLSHSSAVFLSHRPATLTLTFLVLIPGFPSPITYNSTRSTGCLVYFVYGLSPNHCNISFTRAGMRTRNVKVRVAGR